MYHLFTSEMIDGEIQDISCGYYHSLQEAKYAAICDYKEVKPLYLTFPDGTEITLNKAN